MKRLIKLFSLILTAAFLCALTPSLVSAASGTATDPIPLKVGETVTVPGGSIKYVSFTPPEDGVYTFDGIGTWYATHPETADVKIVYESAFLHGGFTYKFRIDSVNDTEIRVLDEGRLYYNAGVWAGHHYLIWDFDPDTGTLTVDNGEGYGRMANLGEDFYPWDPLEDVIKHVKIGEGVTEIGDYAFTGMIESSSTPVPKYAVLNDVTFPSTLKLIGRYCFAHCGALTYVSPFPKSLECVQWMAFFDCPLLSSAVFEGPTAVEFCAFSNCPKLEDVTVKDPGMTAFGVHAFRDTGWIRKLAEGNKGAAVVNGVLIGAYKAWDKEEDDGVLVIPGGVKKIAPQALSGTTTDPAGGEEGTQVDWYLVEVVIPDSVTEIGKGAFSNCTNLERVTIGNGVTTIPNSCFSDDFELRTVNYGKNVSRIEDYAFINTWLPGDIVIPDTVVYIGRYAFQLSEIPLGASWIYNPDAFGGIYADKEYRPKDFSTRNVVMGPALAEIGKDAFDGWEDGWEGAFFTIKGYDGTYAESWAKENEYNFESLGKAPAASRTFKDVPSNAYYAEAVGWAFRRGVTTGTDAKHFSPDNTCTRGQIVTFLWRAAGEPEPDAYDNPFKDVKPSDYFYKAVLWAVHKEITLGTSENRFSPNAPCTRAQCVTFLWRAKGSPYVGSVSSFSDVSVNSYYADAVAWAIRKGVTNGTGNGRFSPNAPCTRAQIVTFLYRAQ